jgi:rhombotail lipoprotein
MKRLSSVLFSIIIVAALPVIGGCAGTTRHQSSSVVEYLYPGDQHVETAQVPRLALPLKVGVAFVPEPPLPGGSLTEIEKTRLLEEISKDFKELEFVKSIEILPSAYLTPKGSFANLDQIRTMYGIDVIALVSYDQTQFTDEGMLSLTYWTLVGAYIVPGEKNDTHTMVDAAVYDIASRKMLFRAPGVSHIEGKSTPVNLSEQLREDSIEGFRLASDNMVANLKIQLEKFQQTVKDAPEEYQVVHREGYTGGGSVDFLLLLAILASVGLALSRRGVRP